jgi:hypothetical protein
VDLRNFDLSGFLPATGWRESDIAQNTEKDQDRKMTSVASKVRLPPQRVMIGASQLLRQSSIVARQELSTRLFASPTDDR